MYNLNSPMKNSAMKNTMLMLSPCCSTMSDDEERAQILIEDYNPNVSGYLL
jgi:hypothetical protein